jgi:hypothetical protein
VWVVEEEEGVVVVPDPHYHYDPQLNVGYKTSAKCIIIEY